jgi:hypothetical protein
MTRPAVPQNRASTLDPAATEPANEPAFPTETATSAAPSHAGWDPYEVWRTRVFAAAPTGNKKG